MSFITSAGEGMRAHQWPGIDPCMGQPLFPAAPGGVLSASNGGGGDTHTHRGERISLGREVLTFSRLYPFVEQRNIGNKSEVFIFILIV